MSCICCLFPFHHQYGAVCALKTGQTVQRARLRQSLPYPLRSASAVVPDTQRQDYFTLWRFKAGHIAKSATLSISVTPQGGRLPMLCMATRRLRRGLRHRQNDGERGRLPKRLRRVLTSVYVILPRKLLAASPWRILQTLAARAITSPQLSPVGKVAALAALQIGGAGCARAAL